MRFFVLLAFLIAPLTAHAGVETTATSSEDSLTTTHAVTKPSGLASGELWLVFFRVGFTSDRNVTAPVGWTKVAERNNDGVSGSTDIFAVVADGTEGATEDFTTGATIRSAHVSYRISGFEGGAADIEALFASTDVNDPPSITPSWGGSPTTLYIAAVTSLSSDDVFTAPSNYGSLVTGANASASFNTRAEIAAAHRELAGSPEDPNAFGVTGTLDGPHSVTVAIELSGGGTAIPTTLRRRRD